MAQYQRRTIALVSELLVCIPPAGRGEAPHQAHRPGRRQVPRGQEVVMERIPLESGESFLLSVINGGVMITGPQCARLTRSDAEALADALYLAGMEAQPGTRTPTGEKPCPQQ
jgi:hypothetical protein